MSDIEKTEEEKMQTRRKLLTSAGKVAITAPAVALLLSASSMPAAAHPQYDSIPNSENGADSPGGFDEGTDPDSTPDDEGAGGDNHENPDLSL